MGQLSGIPIGILNNLYEPVITVGTSSQYFRGDKTWQTLQQSAVAGLMITDSPTFAGLTIGSALAGGNVNVNATIGSNICPDLVTPLWTLDAGWAYLTSPNRITKNANGGAGTYPGGNATPASSMGIVAGVTYKVVITVDSVSGTLISYSLGGRYGSLLAAAGTYTDYITALNTDNLKFTSLVKNLRIVISAITVQALTNGSLSVAGGLNISSPILGNISHLGGYFGVGTNAPTSLFSVGIKTLANSSTAYSNFFNVYDNGTTIVGSLGQGMTTATVGAQLMFGNWYDTGSSPAPAFIYNAPKNYMGLGQDRLGPFDVLRMGGVSDMGVAWDAWGTITDFNLNLDGGLSVGYDIITGYGNLLMSGKLCIGTSTLGGSKLSIVGLPTAAAGLSAGDVWVDTTGGLNILKIV